jgi:hypothetical protein
MHTNQQYRLKVIEANTNLSGTEVHAESLKAQWVIVDVINENKLLEVVSLP